jgi:hypothetical protein
LPGASAAPQCEQDKGAGSDAATGSGISGATAADTVCPHPPQNRFPSATSLPHFVQYLFAMSLYRGSALVAEGAARIENLAALYALAIRWSGRFLEHTVVESATSERVEIADPYRAEATPVTARRPPYRSQR